jgi:hypothetical protein
MYMYVCNFHFVNEKDCIFFTHYDIFPGQMSYVNHRGPRLYFFFVELSTARKIASCRATVVHVLSLKHDVPFPAAVY